MASTKGQKPLVFGEKPNPVGTWYFTSAHNRDTILNINHLTRTRSIASLPCKIVFGRFDATSFQEIILSSGVFRRETARGFYPWGNVECPRKRVPEGLCGWRHGNSFPMTQSAQPHRQMRSIPLCSKAVFYVFVSVPPTFIHWTIIIAPSNFPLSQSTSPQKAKKTALAEDKCASCEGCVYIKMERRLNQAPQSRRIEWGCFVESPSLPYLCVLDMVP